MTEGELTAMAPEVSVVAPVFNEADGIAEFCERVAATLDGETYELVLVDDGSTDDSAAVIARLHERDPRVRLVALSRNFGPPGRSVRRPRCGARRGRRDDRQ
jgi:glycosyltransferase involved in cell wall biosynthesis